MSDIWLDEVPGIANKGELSGFGVVSGVED